MYCLLIVLLVCVDTITVTNGCNEAVCASIVSKCMLTQSCKCDDFKLNKTCSRDCYHCLDYLYQDCCSCVEMCPKASTNDSLAAKSHVEELPEPQPDLFNVLTEERDHLLRWTSYTSSVKIVVLSSVSGESHKDIKYASNKETKPGFDGIDREEELPVNCTVAYMSQCMSWNKCKSSCTSMGANAYRWFHDGCCECVGMYCVNYGINESKCLQCPITADHDVDMSIDETNTRTEDKNADYDFDDNYAKSREDENENNKEHNALTGSEKNVDTKFDNKPSDEFSSPKKANI